MRLKKIRFGKLCSTKRSSVLKQLVQFVKNVACIKIKLKSTERNQKEGSEREKVREKEKKKKQLESQRWRLTVQPERF